MSDNLRVSGFILSGGGGLGWLNIAAFPPRQASHKFLLSDSPGILRGIGNFDVS